MPERENNKKRPQRNSRWQDKQSSNKRSSNRSKRDESGDSRKDNTRRSGNSSNGRSRSGDSWDSRGNGRGRDGDQSSGGYRGNRRDDDRGYRGKGRDGDSGYRGNRRDDDRGYRGKGRDGDSGYRGNRRDDDRGYRGKGRDGERSGGGYRGKGRDGERSGGGYRGKGRDGDSGYRGNRRDDDRGYRGKNRDGDSGYRGKGRDGDRSSGGYRGKGRDGERSGGGYRGNRRDDDGGYRGKNRDGDSGYRGNRRDDDGGYRGKGRDGDSGYRGNRRDDDRGYRGKGRDGERSGGGYRGNRRDDDRGYRGGDRNRGGYRDRGENRGGRGDFNRRDNRGGYDRYRDEEQNPTGDPNWGGLANKGVDRIFEDTPLDEWDDDQPRPRRGETMEEATARFEERQKRREKREENRERLRQEAQAALKRSGYNPTKEDEKAKTKANRAKPNALKGKILTRQRQALIQAKQRDPKRQLIDALGESRGKRTWRDLKTAGEHLGANRLNEALAIVRPLHRLVPQIYEVSELYGLVLYRQGRWRSAIDVLETLRETSGSVDQHPVLADAHRALGNWADVEFLIKELGDYSPDSAIMTEGQIVAAGALADQGNISAAVVTLSKGWGKRRPKKPMEHHLRRAYALADLYDRGGDQPKATELFSWIEHHAPGYLDVAQRSRQTSPKR